jgi:hypothetical protein
MIDVGWQNTFILDPELEGSFLFSSPAPRHAEQQGRATILRIRDPASTAPDVRAFHHFFKIEMESEEETGWRGNATGTP